MGRRYQAILNHLGERFVCFDKEHSVGEIQKAVDTCDRIIIASPTDTHAYYLSCFLMSRKPILCEKPITKDISELEALISFCKDNDVSFTMMMQYQELLNEGSVGETTVYDYFRTGPDGFPWDAFQPVALAQDAVIIDNKSPIWCCVINGQYLSFSSMDRAYVSFVRDWLCGRVTTDLDTYLKWHKKVEAYGKAAGYLNRDTSPVNLDQVPSQNL